MEPQNPNTTPIPPIGDDSQSPPSLAVAPEPVSPELLSSDPSGSYSYTPDIMPANPQKGKFRRLMRLFLKWGAVAIAVVALIGVGVLLVWSSRREAARLTTANPSDSFETQTVPLDSLAVDFAQEALVVRQVIVNGQLQIGEGMILTPSLQPSAPQPGQLYYDQNTNLLGYFNGTEFVYLDAVEIPDIVIHPSVEQIAGLTGQIGLGPGLTVAGGSLVNNGVISLGGSTGAIAVGAGLSIAGNVLQNSGVLNIVGGSGIQVTDDGSGTYTIANVGAGNGTVSSSGGTVGRIPVFTDVQNIENSLISQSGMTVTVSGDLHVVTGGLSLSNPLTVSNGGTGATSFAPNGVLIGNGTGPITAVTAPGPNLCLLSTAGAPIFTACPSASGVTTLNGLNGALTIANASAAGSIITIDNASTSAKGIAQFSSANFTDNGAGVINTIQDIHTGATPTFAGLNTNSINPSSALTVGAAGQTAFLQGSTATITAASGDIVLTSAGQIRLTGFNCSAFANGGTLTTDASGNLICANDDGSPGGGVSSVNSLVGDLVLQGTAGQIVVTDNGSDTLTLSLASDVTLQGNTFNGANQLVQLNGFGQLPAVSGALLTNLNGSAISSGTIDNARLVNGGELTVTAGTNLTGGGSVALGGTITLHVTDNPTFSGNVVVEGGIITLGTVGQVGSLVLHDGNGQTTTLQAGDSTGNLTFILPSSAGNVAQCLKQGGGNQLIWDDCEGGLGGISGVVSLNSLGGALTIQGTTNRIVVTDDGNDTITISAPQDIHTAASPTFAGLTLTGDVAVEGGTVTIGSTSQAASLVIHDGDGQTVTLEVGNLASDLTFILPTTAGNSFQCLKKGAGNQLIWDDCEGGSGPSGVTSLNGLVAALTLQGTADQIVVSDDGVDTITLSLGAAVTLQGNTFNGANQLVQLNGSGELPALSGVNLTNLNASALTIGTVSSSVISGAYTGITGVGTISTGTWQGAAIAIAHGGTGATTQQGAINNLSGLTTQGDLLYHNGTNVTRLPRGNNGECLVSTATTIQWGSCLGGGALSGSGTPGTIAVFTDTDEIGDSILSQSGSAITVGGNLNITSGGQIQINGVPISSADLSDGGNLAKLNASQTFTGATVAFQNSSDSTNAFNIQNAAGVRVLTVNTTAGQVELGTAGAVNGSLVFYNANDNNTVTILSDALTSNRTILLPDADGTICLDTGNCAGVGDVLQGGNSFGTTMTIGTNDNNDLVLERNNAARLTIGANNLTLASGIDLLLQGANAFISNPQGQTNSESFGLNAVVSGANSLAVGAGTSTHSSGGSTAVGAGAEAGVNGTSLGYNSGSQGNAVALGAGAQANSGGIAIGVDANNIAYENSIALGREAFNTAANQLVIGSGISAIKHVVIGNGVTHSVPVDFLLQGTSGSGTNVAGADVYIAGGQGTGNADGGSINFQISDPVADPSGDSSTLNALATVLGISGANGAITAQNSTDSTSAFRILSAGGDEVLTVDTLNRIFSVNGAIHQNLTAEDAPELVAALTSSNYRNAQGLDIQGNYAYIVSDASVKRLSIVDITDPANPVEVSSINSAQNLFYPKHIRVKGNYAYIVNDVTGASPNRQFVIYDISNPNNPTLAGYINDADGTVLDRLQSLEVVGNYAYVASRVDDNFSVIDISNPNAPAVIATITDSTDLNGPKYITVHGKYAYVSLYDGDGLAVIDISNPRNPTLVTKVGSTGGPLNGANGSRVRGKYLYVAAENNHSLTPVNIEDPTAPVIGTPLTDTTNLNLIQDIDIFGDYIVAASSNADSLSIIDISTPASPVLLSSTQDSTNLDGAQKARVYGRYIYAVADGDDVSSSVGAFSIWEIGGFKATTADIGELRVNNLFIDSNGFISGLLTIQNGLNVGSNVNIQGGLSVSSNAGAPAFNVDPGSGKVGIGISTPDRTLDLQVNTDDVDAPPFRILQEGSGDASMEFVNSTGSWYFGLDASASNAFTINSSAAAKVQYVETIERIGSVNKIMDSSDSSSESISVPDDADIVVVAVSGYRDRSGGAFSGATMTLGGQNMTNVPDATTASTAHDQSAIWYMVLPPTGSQTLAWDWNSTPNDDSGFSIYYTFYKGVDTDNPIKDSYGAQSGSSPIASDTLSAASGDALIAVASVARDTSNPTNISWTNATEVDDAIFNNNRASFAEAFPSGDTTVSASSSGGSGSLHLSLSAITLSMTDSIEGAVTDTFSNALLTLTQTGVLTLQNMNDSTSAFSVLNVDGTSQFTIDTANSRVYIGSPAADSTGALLVLDTKNTSGDPTGVDGAMYYSSVTASMRCYEGGYWWDCNDNSRNGFRLFSEFMSTNDEPPFGIYGTFGSTATYLATEANHPGIVRLQTGTSASGSQGVGIDNINDRSVLFSVGEVWRGETVLRIPTLSTGTQSFVTLFGFMDSLDSEPTDGCYFRYDHSTNGGRWEGRCSDAGTSTCDTGITVAASTWYRLTVVVADGQATFYINGSSTCTVSSNIPSTAGNETGFNLGIRKTAGTTTRTMDVDYMEMRVQVTR